VKRAILIVCALAGTARADLPVDGVWISLPSIDGATGAEVGVERYLPARKLGVIATLGMRKTVAGDYRGVGGGAGVEARWYWRAHDMRGWFVGARADLAFTHTRDVADDRSLGTALVLGAHGLFGLRVVPWRRLTITGDLGIGFRNEHDLRGRLPPWTMGSITVGLEVGWMF
jgi:hypothetical protein